MSLLKQVPEAADGVYWYTAPTEVVTSGRIPINIPNPWSATYATIDGELVAVVSTPQPVEVEGFETAPQQVLDAASVTERNGIRSGTGVL